ncbi:hypothetical protein EKO04_009850 [Ascochyta lentis]|uniref:Uncharacterized protein n=1 Tax=Ascochyta lentis TaxID=205686 RepID=A0A8H7IU37_9PLEO|nr:hypothetical protein EKO04_009850 [Ascochyta lentis]
MSPPYSIRWTSRLIRRDIKVLAAGCTSKVRNLFSRSANASTSTPHVRVEIERPIDTIDLQEATFTSSEPSFFGSSAEDTESTAPTQVTEATPEASNTLYELLDTRLKDLYASRDRDVSLEDRWLFRGAWLLLHMATQYCASNPSYYILGGGTSGISEATLLLEILQYSVSKPLETPSTDVGRMPTMPYTKCDDDSTRRDSGCCTTSLPPPPSLAFLWYGILAGATDQAKTIRAAECLLGHVWPEKNATAVLEVVGNPAKRLSEDESTELRDQLSLLLYPEYGALCCRL